MFYNHREIESKWQKFWAENQTFKADNHSDKPKFYVLDMFPYPSGAGLHVGHPLGYIASDIYARYKRHQGFNVLHPQGYDSFGLPAEQYAIQTGQHPAVTTETNIATYRKQLDKIGFSFDWSRELRTSNPDYYKWTQWIFIQLFNSWYNKETDKAEDISTLIEKFQKEGNTKVNAVSDEDISLFTAEEWNAYTSEQQQEILLKYRLTYLSDTEVNWCPQLGTVLANDEIVNGVSERGGYPVVRKKMTQWSMRISAYAQRLLDGLDSLDWTASLKESQTNWIGRSQGAMVTFKIDGSSESVEVFTTRPDTIFGVSFMTLAPENELVLKIVSEEQRAEVEAYIEATSKRSERDRMADVKTISGVFTGAYAIHPFTGKQIPIWIGDYVLASYGTGAVMAVPAGDERDYAFAKHFNIDIINIFEGVDISKEAFTDKTTPTPLINSDFLNGLTVKKAMKLAIYELEQKGIGYGKVNYRLRDAVFSRQRYWGEPFPVYYKNGMPQMIDAKYLPITLPEVEKYLPTEDGQPPLGRADVWAWDTEKNEVVSNDKINHTTIFPLELNTMPGWAGSSWYFNRYMDANNADEFASKEALDYWKEVDLYIGGSEHATGHLLYARFWQKFLFDRDLVQVDEFAKKLINQGMILGESAKPYVLLIKLKDIDETEELEAFIKNFSVAPFLTKDFADEITDSWTSFIDLSDEFQESILKFYNNFEGYSSFKKENIIVNKSLLDMGFNVNHVDRNNYIDIDKVKTEDFRFFKFDNTSITKNRTFRVEREVEKMSKSKFNVVNPDDICEEYGADCLRLYEMFLGPLEQSKPWNTQGLTGVYGFLKKFYNLYYNEDTFEVSEEEPTKEEYKILHTLIKKFNEDVQNFSFNTSVASFMIAVNELQKLKCNKRAILEPLAIIISSYAPHICEELWRELGHDSSIEYEKLPEFNAAYLVEDEIEYPISVNGKMKFKMKLSATLNPQEVEEIVLNDERMKKQIGDKTPKKVIVVPKRIVNIVL